MCPDALPDDVAALVARVEQLEAALEHRTTTSEAVGMLMERYGLDADQAFAMVRRVSQNSNRKLYDVATELVDTGEIARVHPPEAPDHKK